MVTRGGTTYRWPAEPEPLVEHLPRSAHKRLRRPPRGRRGWIFWLVPVLLGLAVWLGLLGAERHYRGRILPNVYVAGVPVGGLTPEEAEAALRRRFHSFQERPVTLTYEGRVWYPRGDQLGLQVAWDQAVQDAVAAGREGSFLGRWWERLKPPPRRDVLLPVVLDKGVLQSYLQELAQEIDMPALNAALTVEGTEVQVRPSHPGRRLRVVPTMAAIEAAIGHLSSEPVPLEVEVLAPEIDEQAVEGALETAHRMLAGPLTIRIRDREWVLTPEEIGRMLRVETRQEGTQKRLAVVLDQEALRAFVAQIAGQVLVYPRNAHFRFVEDHLEVVDPGASGWMLPLDAAVDQLNAAVVSPKREVDLELVEVPPEIRPEVIDSLGIRELVAVGESHFAGSRPYREHNIVIGARILDGTLIPPGGTFSFLQAIGPIDESQGFVEGYSIIAERTVRNVGGGICQVSTTVFRAALLAGLPILERHPHAYRIGFYEQGSIPGLDATIFVGTGTDLKFVNDTPGYLLMQLEAYTDTDTLLVYLYGTKPNREVRIEGPEMSNWTPAPTTPVCVENPSLEEGVVRQTDWAVDGIDVRVYRTILVNGEVVSQEVFFSPYAAWPNIYEKHSCP
ncbi:MAG: VanW family protein [Chloroflexia bacterium]